MVCEEGVYWMYTTDKQTEKRPQYVRRCNFGSTKGEKVLFVLYLRNINH